MLPGPVDDVPMIGIIETDIQQVVGPIGVGAVGFFLLALCDVCGTSGRGLGSAKGVDDILRSGDAVVLVTIVERG